MRSLDTEDLLIGSLYENFFYPPFNFHNMLEKKQLMLVPVLNKKDEWIACAIFSKTEDGSLYLHHLMVSESERNKGLGRTIIQNLFSQIKPKRISLFSTKNALNFYIKEGFKKDENADTLTKNNPYSVS